MADAVPSVVQTAIETNAQGPKMARGDSGEMSQHTLEDQIKADKYLSANQGFKKNHGGIRMVKLQASGTVL